MRKNVLRYNLRLLIPRHTSKNDLLRLLLFFVVSVGFALSGLGWTEKMFIAILLYSVSIRANGKYFLIAGTVLLAYVPFLEFINSPRNIDNAMIASLYMFTIGVVLSSLGDMVADTPKESTHANKRSSSVSRASNKRIYRHRR